ncbi:hypothetical protein [Streptomyces sp. NEAU-H3]|uniref:hypothetical protein n=1 Tax=Streptomyces sp. NEAU-H3 TaxID=2720636 RepID=UPI0014394D25|nr:hypothetical protein [Streptomyces sp. NEAU-H3]NJA59407.1 hypothetical protein [Streptomyces sp. NEAU-H3]
MTTSTPPAESVDPQWADKLARLKGRRRPVATLTICDDPRVKDNLAEARDTLAAAEERAQDDPGSKGAKADLARARKSLTTAQAAYDDEAIVLRFEALERSALKALIAQHPPTEEQAEDGFDFNRDTLTPDLIAISSLDGLTTEDAQHFLDTWAQGEADLLSNSVFSVQRDLRMDLGKG